MAETPRTITICADDFGLGGAVDEAVQALAAQGRLGAVSCMAAAPRWPGAAAGLRATAASELDVGLHLDLTEHVFDAGLRHSLGRWIAQSWLRAAPRARLRAEIAAQLDAFESALGRPPAHVDGHQHVHQFPVVRELLVDLLARRYPARRPWLRSTRRPAQGAAPKAWLIQALGAGALARLAVDKGFSQNGHLLGVYDFAPDAARYLALAADWLRVACPGDVLMCHPATRAESGDAIGAARQMEFEVLGGPQFAALLQAQGVRVAPFTHRLRAAGPPS